MSLQSNIYRMAALAGSLLPQHVRVMITTALLTLSVMHNAYAAAPSQDPLFLSNPVVPIMMLNMSRDHQLFFKIYDDYSDITDPNGGAPDGTPDRGFVRKYNYFGYFDSGKCYTYNTTSNQFVPTRATDQSNGNNSYCNYSGGSNEWSGNFLNWASMTRMDAIRKILYGGYRSTDTSTETVLERAFLPNDAHSFAKFYDGNDIKQLTPFDPPKLQATPATGITICNTTAATGYSQSTTAAPLIRVAKGNYTLWASNERWQCRWDAAPNGNSFAASGINAYTTAPASASADKLGSGSAAGEYYVRVQVCKSATGISTEENCQQYPSATYANKPTGLLQKYGETNRLNFGLITGTYGKNKSGGVLRKNVGNMLDEINTTAYGTFKSAPATGGIINTLNLLRLYGYAYDTGDSGSYKNTSPGADCGYGLSSFAEGACSNWGNPQSEIYYESLRYLAGTTRTSSFSNAAATTDAGYISGLTQATWSPVITSANACAPLSVLQFNASSNSYDVGTSASYANLNNIGLTDTTALNAVTNEVGGLELITNTSRFVGMLTSATLGSNPNGNQLCTAKTIDNLSNVSGTCPDSPRLDGGYSMVGLARHARKMGIPISGLNVAKTVRTYGVALAPSLPKIEVPVPGSTTGQKVIIQPACRNNSTNPATNCAIVDFKIVNQTSNIILAGLTGNATSLNGTVGTQGKLYVNWEDSEQGGDYDQDMWGVIEYAVTATKVMVKTQVLAQSTPNIMGFGYVLTGTDGDGFNVQSGINSFLYGTTCTAATGNRCTCRADTSFGACATTPAAAAAAAAARTKVFNVLSSSAGFLESPLYYAAKWGGYDKDFAETNATGLDAAIKSRVPTDTYFYATDPKELATKIEDAFDRIANDVGSSASVATNSTSLNEGTYIYQAQFNSENWSGTLNAFAFDKDGKLSKIPTFSTANLASMPKTGVGRKVYTYNGSARVDFAWANLTTGTNSQQAKLQLSTEATTVMAQKRVDWLLGNATNEGAGGLRDRGDGDKRVILGDIVNSSPAYVGAWDFRYQTLPTIGSTYRAYVEAKKQKMPRVFVGSNDGMVHAFQAPTDDVKTFKELYTYIPNSVFPKLAKLTLPNYGNKENPHEFVVDGPITVGDVYLNSEWRTIIVGTLGAGGRGVYALDVTDDTSAPKVLFELDENDYPKLGYVMGKPLIVPMKNGRWAVIFGNGSGSGNNSSLFVVDIEFPKNPSYTKVIDVGTGLGLSAPALLANGVGQAEVAYAGDLSGNLWRFDLSDASQNNWRKDYLLFSAKDKNDVSGNVQPISGAPTLGINAKKSNKVMVYFGTGKYFDVGDNSSASVPVHSFYAITDVGSIYAPVLRSSLLARAMVTSYSETVNTRIVSLDLPDWTTQNGWYLNFGDTGGERVTTKPILLQDKLVFPTLIPSGVACEYGGKSWLMEVTAVGNKYPNAHMLEGTDSDGILLPFLILGNLGFGQVDSPPPEDGGGETEVKEDCTGKGAIVGSGSDSTLLNVAGCYDKSAEGRQSWRQLR